MLAGFVIPGIARSGGAHQQAFAFAVTAELALAAASCALALPMHLDARVVADGMAVWAFCLVQSAYGLWPAARARRDTPVVDAFEAAYTATDQVMRTRR